MSACPRRGEQSPGRRPGWRCRRCTDTPPAAASVLAPAARARDPPAPLLGGRPGQTTATCRRTPARRPRPPWRWRPAERESEREREAPKVPEIGEEEGGRGRRTREEEEEEEESIQSHNRKKSKGNSQLS